MRKMQEGMLPKGGLQKEIEVDLKTQMDARGQTGLREREVEELNRSDRGGVKKKDKTLSAEKCASIEILYVNRQIYYN